MHKLHFGIGEKLDIFFAMEENEIFKIFYNKKKCLEYIEKENKRRKNGQSNLFN